MSSSTYNRDPRAQALSLDTLIRRQARLEANKEFLDQVGQFLKKGHAGTWNKDFTYEDFKQLQQLLDRFCSSIIIPQAEQVAIDTFLATYQRLKVEFPDFGGDNQ